MKNEFENNVSDVRIKIFAPKTQEDIDDLKRTLKLIDRWVDEHTDYCIWCRTTIPSTEDYCSEECKNRKRVI